ncbi:unnamed protein product [Trichobilharzia szidati]|nr:unnamed protein product [Trichobilharzia szidati]
MHTLSKELESSLERHTRFTETQIGALVFHDHNDQKYYRNYQFDVDMDIVRRFVTRNLCGEYPPVTLRYFAQNWPELCIIAFTDTHIPIGIIIGQQTEPHVGRITFFAVEKRVEANIVYKKLLQLEVMKMHQIGIRKVFLKPADERMEMKLMRYIGSTGPLRNKDDNGEYQFHI